jgi:hypothetical protein
MTRVSKSFVRKRSVESQARERDNVPALEKPRRSPVGALGAGSDRRFRRRDSPVIDRRYRIEADTAATTSLVFFVSEETALADDLGDLRWDRFLPAFVAGGDALEDVS